MDLQPISYQANGRAYTGFLADGSGGALAPGMLLLHEGGGLTDHVKARAARIAREIGAVAFTMDLFGADVALPEPGRPETLAAAQAVVRALREDVAELRARCAAALAVLQRHPQVDPARLAALGFCFGGAAAIELARAGAPLAAVAGFHAGIIPGSAEDDARIRAKVLLCHGEDDPVVPATQIRAFANGLDAAGVECRLHLYGGVGHSFTNPEIDAWGLPGFAYDADADARAWAALRQLLDEAF
ncbi:MAG TPA: dienelactone hydrolase family protein [Allosphingosinicella sp.]|nr:dienelactone hydrolase family protein [Allosphingosinicella sp.]